MERVCEPENHNQEGVGEFKKVNQNYKPRIVSPLQKGGMVLPKFTKLWKV